MGSHERYFHTYNLLTLRKLHTNQRHLPRDCQCPSPLLYFLLILMNRDLCHMMGDKEKSHRICEYLRCSPKVFPTLVQFIIILNPLPPPLPIFLFLRRFFPQSPLCINPYSKLLLCTLSSTIS